METTEPSPPQSRRLFLPALLALSGGAAALAGVRWWTLRQLDVLEQLRDPPDRIGRNAPFIPSADPVVDKMVEVARLTPQDVVYDLGCGDGKIVIAAARASGCRGVGFDIDPALVAEAKENAKRHEVEHLVEIREQDVFTVDMREASVAMFYLLSWMIKKLIPQFQQMQPGSRLISHDFAFGDTKYIPPEETVTVPGAQPHEDHYVFRWTIPLKVPSEPMPR